jgi:hypothetical protein
MYIFCQSIYPQGVITAVGCPITKLGAFAYNLANPIVALRLWLPVPLIHVK